MVYHRFAVITSIVHSFHRSSLPCFTEVQLHVMLPFTGQTCTHTHTHTHTHTIVPAMYGHKSACNCSYEGGYTSSVLFTDQPASVSSDTSGCVMLAGAPALNPLHIRCKPFTMLLQTYFFLMPLQDACSMQRGVTRRHAQ